MIADIPLGYIHILIDDKSDRFQFKEVIADRASLLQKNRTQNLSLLALLTHLSSSLSHLGVQAARGR